MDTGCSRDHNGNNVTCFECSRRLCAQLVFARYPLHSRLVLPVLHSLSLIRVFRTSTTAAYQVVDACITASCIEEGIIIPPLVECDFIRM